MDRRIGSITTVLVLAAAPAAFAVGPSEAFLKIPVGAREVGMGEAFTAVADDANAAFWNPAGLGQLSKREFSATDAMLFADQRYDSAAYVQPTRIGNFGVSAGYLNQGQIQGYDANRNPTGTFGASDMVVGVSFGRPVGAMELGVTVKYIKSQIADQHATGEAVDLGVLMPTRVPGLGFGMTVQNLGPGVTYIQETDPLPTTAGLGLAYQTPFGMTLSADVKRQFNDGSTLLSAGGELPLGSLITARAGYARSSGGPVSVATVSSGLMGFAGGFGVKVLGYDVNYAFTPMGELGSEQRISLGTRF